MKESIKIIIHSLICWAYNLLGYFYKINKNKVFFESFPDYSDNARAFSDYLASCSDYDIYWAVQEIPTYKVNSRIHFIRKYEKNKYLYHTLTSKYLFSTHGAFHRANPKRQIYLCFWHGTMLKRIAYMQDPVRNKFCNCSVSFFSSPSDFYTPLYAQCFNRNENEILLTGYPRIDFLLNENDSFFKLGINKARYSKVIMYLPTFRQPISGDYTDTTKNIFTDDFIDFTSKDSLIRWNNFFTEKRILLMVKPHPSDKNQLPQIELSNILVIPHKTLLENDIQLYSLLHYADALITDFSSVYCDYLVLNRPIGFVLSDMDEYAKGRGFVFEKPLDVLPGYKIFDEEGFVSFCDDISNNIDSTKQLRKDLQPMYNKYTEGCFSERVANMLNMKVR